MTEVRAAFKLNKSAPVHTVFGLGEEVEHPDLRALLKLWNDKRGDRAMPARTDISPRDMKAYLRRVHLYDVVDRGKDFRVRVVSPFMAMSNEPEQVGKCISELSDQAIGRRYMQIMQHVVSVRRPVRVVADHLMQERFAMVQVEALWLPLGTGENVEQLLAASLLTLNRCPDSSPSRVRA